MKNSLFEREVLFELSLLSATALKDQVDYERSDQQD